MNKIMTPFLLSQSTTERTSFLNTLSENDVQMLMVEVFCVQDEPPPDLLELQHHLVKWTASNPELGEQNVSKALPIMVSDRARQDGVSENNKKGFHPSLLTTMLEHLHLQPSPTQSSVMYSLLNFHQHHPKDLMDLLCHPLTLKYKYPRAKHHVTFYILANPPQKDHEVLVLREGLMSTLTPEEMVHVLSWECQGRSFYRMNRTSLTTQDVRHLIDLCDQKPLEWQKQCQNLWHQSASPEETQMIEEWSVWLEKKAISEHVIMPTTSSPKRLM